MAGDNAKSWFTDNWFRLAVLIVTAIVGWTQMLNRVDMKLDAQVFEAYKSAEALRAADAKRDRQELSVKVDQILDVLCEGQTRAPGCKGR